MTDQTLVHPPMRFCDMIGTSPSESLHMLYLVLCIALDQPIGELSLEQIGAHGVLHYFGTPLI